MALSNREQALFDELEKQLKSDPTFSSAVPTVSSPQNKVFLKLIGGILLAILGLAVMIYGLIIQITLVGVLGFVVMYVGTYVAFDKYIDAYKRKASAGAARAANRPNFRV